MAPRKGKKKQTRLAFAPSAAAPSHDAESEQNSRYSTLTYANPSLGTLRSQKLTTSASQASPVKKRPNSGTERNSFMSSGTSVISSRKPQRALQFPLKDTANTHDLDEPSEPRRAPKRKRRSSPMALSDSDEPVVSSSVKKRKARKNGGSSSSPLVLSEDDDDDETEIVAPSTARKRRARPAVTVDENDDSDEPIVTSPTKRLRRGKDTENSQTPRTPRHISKQAKLDIEEDLEDLQDSVVKKTRTRGRNVKSARDKRLEQLEVLRRRRAGLKEESEDEESPDSDVEEIGTPPSDASPSGEGLWKHHNTNSDVESTIDPNEDLDRYEDDFVLEDENDNLGVPMEEIPFEFTRHAYKQPKEYFRDVIGWMVQNKLNTGFPRSDAMYEMAFLKLEDEVKGRAGSQLISSVWTPSFVYALQARPHLDISAFPTEENHSCDACRRSGHPASADMRLFGKAYSLQTLEPLKDEDEDSDASDASSDASDASSDASDASSNADHNDGQDHDRNGHAIPPESVHFYLGRQCKSRAQLAHTLTHWRFHLNEWVIDHLERMGHMKDDEILRRNNLSVKKKTRNANEVLDKMVNTGEVDKLWRDFHLNLKSAREKESLYG